VRDKRYRISTCFGFSFHCKVSNREPTPSHSELHQEFSAEFGLSRYSENASFYSPNVSEYSHRYQEF